jgi:hypothetical protein
MVVGDAMTKIITPKDILEDVLRDLSSRTRANALPKWLLTITRVEQCVAIFAIFVSISTVIVAVISSIGTHTPWVGMVAVIVLTLYRLSASIAIVSWLLSSLMLLLALAPTVLKRLRHPERGELEPMIGAFNNELDIMAQLVCTYERHQLEYAQDHVTLEIAHIRSWDAVWFGSLEKLGVLPLGVVALVSWLKLRADRTLDLPGLLNVNVLGVIALVLVLFYLFAQSRYLVCQRLDRFGLVLKHVVQAKQLENLSLNADAPPVR